MLGIVNKFEQVCMGLCAWTTGDVHMAVLPPYEQTDATENVTLLHYVAGGNHKCSS